MTAVIPYLRFLSARATKSRIDAARHLLFLQAVSGQVRGRLMCARDELGRVERYCERYLRRLTETADFNRMCQDGVGLSDVEQMIRCRDRLVRMRTRRKIMTNLEELMI